jgi:rhamnosyl/mannosyltransferase
VTVEVVVVNHAEAGGKDVTFSTLARTPSVQEFDGPVKVWRVGRWANLAKLDVSLSLPKLLCQLRRDPPDVWHMHAPNVTMMAAMATMKPLAPLVITHHSDIVRQKMLKHLVRPLEKFIYGRSCRIIIDSPLYAAGSTLLKIMNKRVTELPLGIDLKPFQNPSPAALRFASELKAKHGSPLWLCVGRLIYYKALDVALEALVKVPGKLLISGKGPKENEWKAKAVELGVADRVVWLGRTNDEELQGAYRAATAFWFPSNARAEAFGLVQVEAMASGCPIINTAIEHSGVRWVSPDGVSVLTVPVIDADAFAAAARRLLDEPGLRDRLSQGAQARAAAEFDRRIMAERCKAIYEECIAEAKQ